MPRDLSKDEDWDETMAELREQRDRSRSPLQRKRLIWAISKAEALRSSANSRQFNLENIESRKGKIPCPNCEEWVSFETEETGLRCPICGKIAESGAVQALLGSWKFDVGSVLIFWGITLGMSLVVQNSGIPTLARVLAGVVAVASGVMGLPHMLNIILMISWKLRGSPKSRFDG